MKIEPIELPTAINEFNYAFGHITLTLYTQPPETYEVQKSISSVFFFFSFFILHIFFVTSFNNFWFFLTLAYGVIKTDI